DDIRDQRVGAAGSGLTDRSGGPASGNIGAPNAGAPNAGPPQPGQPAPPPAPHGNNGQPVVGGTDEPQKETPGYKKWWVLGGVSAYVVYQLATSSSSMSRTGRLMPLSNNADTQPGGLTLLHW